jgi:exonuclease SbcC
MIRRIELTNFMSHEHTVIAPAAGLTVLIGPNNCGKSAIVAALQILSSNENSTYVMRHGAKECSVKVETDDGHVVEWLRSNSPSYRIDGQTFDRLRGSGLPDELHTALRLPKVEAGDSTDFDVHFGTQKSPIFLLGGSSSNAARFFASSSDAIRLVEMQRRHREKLADAQREKTRLEAESKEVNAALGTLEPVIDIEKRLAAARCEYDELGQIANRIESAEKAEAGLRAQSVTLDRFAVQVDALQSLPVPPELAPVEPLAMLVEAIVAASGRLRIAKGRAETLYTLPEPPLLAATDHLETAIKEINSEQARRRAVEEQTHSLSTLQAPPEMHEVSALDRLLADIVRYAGDRERSQEQSKALSRVSAPPRLADVDPLIRLIERLAESECELGDRHTTCELLGGLHELPRLADETDLEATLGALRRARRHFAHWEARSPTFARIVPIPSAVESSPLSDLIQRVEETEKHIRTCELAVEIAVSRVDEAVADLRSSVEGRACPICGSVLDADIVIAHAAVGSGVHEHG